MDSEAGGFKQFDPVADTETCLILLFINHYWRFKQFDPVADTETEFVERYKSEELSNQYIPSGVRYRRMV